MSAIALAAPRLKAAHEDQRGAVMVMGLMMSCFLIGALWFLIGIGDAIVFRTKMQEAPDHAGFASAVIHAKGMNFIALLNAVMLVLTIVYILMGIVHDILALLCVMTGYACVPFKAWQQAWHAYFNAMKPICQAIHTAEQAIAYAAPWIGTGVAAKIGYDYGQKTPRKPNVAVVAASLSNLPGNLGTQFGTGGILSDGVGKYGLPVEDKPFSALCDKVGRLGGDLLSMTGVSAGAAGGVISSLIQNGVKYRYCSGFDINGFIQGNDTKTKSITGVFGQVLSFGRRLVSRFVASGIGALLGNDPSFDSFWKEDGPLYVLGKAENGNTFFQVWSFNLFPRYEEKRMRKVSLAAKKWDNPYSVAAIPRTYFSQSEFYYDCTKEWKDDACHGDPALDANASYNMRWTVRMHAFEGQFGAQLGGAISTLVANGIEKAAQQALGKVTIRGVQLPRQITDRIGGEIGGMISENLGLGENGATREAIQEGLGFLNVQTTPYH